MKAVIWSQLSQEEKNNILQRSLIKNQEQLCQTVKEIIEKVKTEKDEALKYYSQKYDKAELKDLTLNVQEIKNINLDDKVKKAIVTASENIKKFHLTIKPQNSSLEDKGLKIWREYKAIEKVGLYVPGGSAPLVSTLLMLAVPAIIAKCPKIVLTTPADKNGEINPALIYAAQICGLNKIHKVGGAQAIAALAYGTESIEKVYKIFGPGNKYVTEAKMQVSKDPFGAALDLPAGPSEVLVIADGSTKPQITALDLLAQAEHDPASQAILISNNLIFIEEVIKFIQIEKESLKRKDILEKSLKNAAFIFTENIEEAFNIANIYAPEHLLLQIENPEAYTNLIQNAGSVFLGPWASESFGDYASGPNHVLPTYGYAKNYSGLSVDSFMKAICFQSLNQTGFENLAETVEILADLEGLEAHKKSVSFRKKLI